MDKLLAVLIVLVGGFVLVVEVAFLFAIFTQLSWDASIGQIFHLPPITFWQAFWLNFLGGMVCKSSSVSKSS